MMSNYLFARVVGASLLAALAMNSGCGGDARGPSAPSPPSSPNTAPAVLRVASVVPSSGAAGVATAVHILGSGFQAGATVTFDGTPATVTAILGTNITATTPANAAGVVDVVVTNPGGQTERLASGYTYMHVAAPSVSAISPARGSTSGGTTVTIKGSGFQTGAIVTLGGERLIAYGADSATIYVMTLAHDAGTVEIVVTNPDGQVARLTDVYTYAPPESFDFNGAWQGYALAHPDHVRSARHSDMEMGFIIENNGLTSVTCGGAPVTFSPALPVIGGAFSYSGDEGVVVTGRIVSDASAVGTIKTGACPATSWAAEKR
jgi:IPT/TIG domain